MLLKISDIRHKTGKSGGSLWSTVVQSADGDDVDDDGGDD